MPRLPFVSRERYEELQQILTSERLAHASLREKMDALTHLALSRTLEAPVTSSSGDSIPTVPAEPKPRSVIGEAIRQASEGDERLARYLWKRATQLRKDGMLDGDIATELQRWETVGEPE